MDLTVRLMRARIETLEAEVARLKRALAQCPEGIERGHMRAEVLRVPGRSGVARRLLRAR